MAKKTLVRNQDQFLVRLPEGMRDRIKNKADRAHMSMNDAIVWCLDQFFPAPRTLDEKLSELIQKVAILKGDNTKRAVEELIDEIDEALAAISKTTGYNRKDFAAAVSDRYDQYLEEESDRWRDKHENPFDDENWGSSVDDPFQVDPKPKT